jgi:hypothetical protein
VFPLVDEDVEDVSGRLGVELRKIGDEVAHGIRRPELAELPHQDNQICVPWIAVEQGEKEARRKAARNHPELLDRRRPGRRDQFIQ